MKINLAFGIFFSSIFFFFLSCGTRPATTSGTTETSNFAKFEEDILKQVNQYRASKGLPLLTLNNVISAEAENHSQKMASGRTPFGHSGYSSRINTITNQLGTVTRSAENVAYGSRSAQEVVSNWLNSPGHKQNIEGDFNLTGIGVARNKKGVLYYTQLFIKR